MSAGSSKREAPHPVDAYVGGRVRLRRTFLGYSQEKLGQALGLTFQQIQKYERGLNRISSSKLYELSVLLEVPVSFFFEGLENTNGEAGRPLYGKAGRAVLSTPIGTETAEALARRDTPLLVNLFYRLPNDAVRREILSLMKAIAE